MKYRFTQILMLNIFFFYELLTSFCDQIIEERIDFFEDDLSLEIKWFYVVPVILFGLLQLSPSF